jgi:hypothetical protein
MRRYGDVFEWMQGIWMVLVTTTTDADRESYWCLHLDDGRLVPLYTSDSSFTWLN